MPGVLRVRESPVPPRKKFSRGVPGLTLWRMPHPADEPNGGLKRYRTKPSTESHRVPTTPQMTRFTIAAMKPILNHSPTLK